MRRYQMVFAVFLSMCLICSACAAQQKQNVIDADKLALVEEETQAQLTEQVDALRPVLREQLDYLHAPRSTQLKAYEGTYRELLYYKLRLERCLEYGVPFELPEALPVDGYSPISKDDPIGEETKTRFDEIMQTLQTQSGELEQEAIEQYKSLLYPCIRLELCLENGLEIENPLAPEIDRKTDEYMEEVIRQLNMQGGVADEILAVFRAEGYAQAEFHVYQEHGFVD